MRRLEGEREWKAGGSSSGPSPSTPSPREPEGSPVDMIRWGSALGLQMEAGSSPCLIFKHSGGIREISSWYRPLDVEPPWERHCKLNKKAAHGMMLCGPQVLLLPFGYEAVESKDLSGVFYC